MKNVHNCRAFRKHKVEHYSGLSKEEKKVMKYLLNTICHYHALYYGYSAHIFHRELAEEIYYQLSSYYKLHFKENK